MKNLNEKDICQLVENDQWMMKVLATAKSLNLPDWWIGAGFVRNKVWDYLHNFNHSTSLSDIDVIYFNAEDKEESTEKKLENELQKLLPNLPWSVKNQARMYIANGDNPYVSSTDALARWPETATSIAVKLDEKNQVIINAPNGIDDLVNLRVCPTPAFRSKKEIYESRLKKKNWEAKWPKIQVFHFE
ncbi:MAG: hypothetical protein A2288_03120 [Candidatus Moranbacteria bacterium RIFOXYA12_FULL_44_15]|nr:MAG: hypothetical protein A2288_03120 [Candidatus Moranbacteria bacterium RIFOXYA12_FULL_44_15]OGI35446.1 MAG: hypothetical protein A2259_02560 [Candidatus Moranbacteria bacterium RIFOXYA2_FULL_43_15]